MNEGPFFFTNFLCTCRNHIFQVEKMQSSPKIKTLKWSLKRCLFFQCIFVWFSSKSICTHSSKMPCMLYFGWRIARQSCETCSGPVYLHKIQWYPHDPLREFIGASHWSAFGDVYIVSWLIELGNQLTLYGKCDKTFGTDPNRGVGGLASHWGHCVCKLPAPEGS